MAEFESGRSFWNENLAGWYETVKALGDLGIKVQGIERLPTEIVEQDVGINYRHCVKLVCDIDDGTKEQISKLKLKYGPKIEFIDGGIKISKLQ